MINVVENKTIDTKVIRPSKFFCRAIIDKKLNVRYEYILNSKGKALKLTSVTGIKSGKTYKLSKEKQEEILYRINEWNGYNKSKITNSKLFTAAWVLASSTALATFADWCYSR